jgi:serine phosphatase RsbU (regulator of sigma subunit)
MGQDTPLTPEMVIEDTDYDLIFAYGAIEFTKADKVRYHTQLLGLEKTWSEPNAQRLARYTNLHPGDYTFQVQARNWGGQWSQIAAFSFTIIRNREVQAREEALEQERLERELLHLEHQRKSEELEQARQLQLSLLPTTPPRLPYLEIVAFQNTATEVGGDYYDFLPQADGSLFVAFGDATGHGVSAGLMVTATKMGVLTLWGTEVTQGISLLNSSLIRLNLGQGLNMALNVLHLWPDPATQTIQVEISGGGMPPLYLLRAEGQVEEIEIIGLPLGVVPEAPYRLTKLHLNPADMLIMVSDGVPERFNPQGVLFGFERLLTTIREIGQTTPDAARMLYALLRANGQWANTTPQQDDMTLVILQATL